MHIMTEIDDDLYTRLFDSGETDKFDMLEACIAIRKGKVIPKDHGRIADIDAAIKCIEEVKGEDAAWAISLIEWACDKRLVLEADKEREETSE